MAYAIERRTETIKPPSKNNEDLKYSASLRRTKFAIRTFATSARMSKDGPKSGDLPDWITFRYFESSLFYSIYNSSARIPKRTITKSTD